MTMTYGSARPESMHPGGMSQGGYSSDMVVDENYVIRVPEKMNVAARGPRGRETRRKRKKNLPHACPESEF